MGDVPLRVERADIPRWIIAGDDNSLECLRDVFGEQTEWGFAIPWVARALASPASHESLLRAPRHGDDVISGPVAYWSSLLHLLVYSFGWVRPDRGLRWWYDAGKPVEERRLALLRAVWDADGQLDWFAAWLWKQQYFSRGIPFPEIAYEVDDAAVPVEPEWLSRQIRSAEVALLPNPLAGGSDPLHLSGHIEGPLERPPSPGAMLRTGTAERRAVLLLDSMVGWYRALADHGKSLPPLGSASWHVDVVVKPVGWMGTYRRSRATGVWFSGRHSLHAVGC